MPCTCLRHHYDVMMTYLIDSTFLHKLQLTLPLISVIDPADNIFPSNINYSS